MEMKRIRFNYVVLFLALVFVVPFSEFYPQDTELKVKVFVNTEEKLNIN